MSTVTAAARVMAGASLERELKFALPAGKALLARSIVAALCRPDAKYPAATVSTIYYDAPDFELLSEKINSDYLKTRVRLRWYSGPADQDAFLEIKARVGTLRHKVRVQTALAASMLNDLPLDHPTLVQVLELARPLGVRIPPRLSPALLMRYERSRFVEPVSGSRISVDVNIEVLRGHPRLPRHASPERIGSAVVEVKGAQTDLPRALYPLASLGARRAAFSKYGLAGVAMLGYVH